MKKIVALTAMSFALSGCLSGPDDTDGVRKLAASNGLVGKQTTVVVPRSHAAVRASLTKGAEQCMNRTVRTVSTTPGPYGPQTHAYVTDYTATVKPYGTGTELALYQEVRGGGFLPQPKGYSLVVDAVPVSGGTQLTFHGGRFGYGKLNQAVETWARSGNIICPKLPGS